MSRLGKLPVALTNNVEAQIKDQEIIVKGPKGELSLTYRGDKVKVEQTDKGLLVSIKDLADRELRAYWGLYRSLINNMVKGVTEGFEKKLEISGVGYRANVSGQTLILNMGYSHPVEFPIPEGITITVEKNIITVSGIDKQLVGETAARIRKVRKPDVYKLKGIKYEGEIIIKKEGKTASKGE
jgi:large subunit ribosomal protein L6